MRLIIFVLFAFNSNGSFSQAKNVRIDSEDFYLRFFYKKNQSDRILNDSVYFVCKRIDDKSFYLEKFLKNKKQWVKCFEIYPSEDSLTVAYRYYKNGYWINSTLKEAFYKSKEVH